MDNNEFSWDSTVYRDKFGRIIQADELECLLRNSEYRIVAQDWIGHVLISTVWLGVPFDMGASYFETMVFYNKTDGSTEHLELERYYDLGQAEIGHHLVLKKWKEKLSQSDVSQSTSHSIGHHSQEC